MSLEALPLTRLTGDEPFTSVEGGWTATLAGMTVLDFWQWSASDLLSNTMRGIVAEYIVATALGLADDRSSADTPREEWCPYDLETKDGLKIEVKSCAYIQRWGQKQLSKIRSPFQSVAEGEVVYSPKVFRSPVSHASPETNLFS